MMTNRVDLVSRLLQGLKKNPISKKQVYERIGITSTTFNAFLKEPQKTRLEALLKIMNFIDELEKENRDESHRGN